MKSLEQRVADVLAGKQICPRCGADGIPAQGEQHCTNGKCDVRTFCGGVVLYSGWLTHEMREGPGT